MDENLIKDMDFIIEIDKMKSIIRQTGLIDGSRRENDAEHSWHIATMAITLEEYIDFDVNTNRVVKMLLIHDLVEIYAGDTFCYDKKGNSDKLERELKAADKIFGMLSEEKGKEFRELWEEFERRESNDALFAATMDRLQPILSNYYSGGGTWVKYKIKKSEVYKRIAPIEETSKALWKYVTSIVDDAVDKEYIIND